MDSKRQRMLQMVGGWLCSLIFLALAAYYLTAADGHPRVKHTLLFLGLAVVSALVGWFAMPKKRRAR